MIIGNLNSQIIAKGQMQMLVKVNYNNLSKTNILRKDMHLVRNLFSLSKNINRIKERKKQFKCNIFKSTKH